MELLTLVRTANRELVSAFENLYRYDKHNEHALLVDISGAVITERTGDIDSVRFDPQELDRACMGLLTHNHPKALPPSVQDLALAAEYGLTLRAVGITSDEEIVNYTVQMNAPSVQLKDRIEADYADEIQKAETELSTTELDDRAWQRESRHLAVTRLASRLGFLYVRSAHTSEIAKPKHSTHNVEVRRLDTFAESNERMRTDVYQPLYDAVVRLLVRNSDTEGVVPLSQLSTVKSGATRIVQKTMLGAPQHDGALEPYRIQNGHVIPHSVYFKTLWSSMRTAAQIAIQYHADMMRKYLPSDLLHAFLYAVISPFNETVHESVDDIGLEYDPLHLWVGPDGKRLSDRIWDATGDMRRKLDDYLSAAISSGKPVSQMTQELEPFLLTGNGTYEARRLAHTETAAAYSRADSAAANMNPFVDSYSTFVSPEHKCCDICDTNQANSPYPKTDTTHLPPFHPECVDGIVWHEVGDIQKVVIGLRQKIDAAVAAGKRAFSDFIGPLSKRFIDLLFRSKS